MHPTELEDLGVSPQTPKHLISLYNSVWPQYQLGDRNRWPVNGSLNYNTTLQLDLLCQRQKERDEIPYVQFFMVLYPNKGLHKGCGLSSIEVILVLHPPSEDLLDLFPNPLPTALSLPPSFICPNLGQRPVGPPAYQPPFPEPSPATTGSGPTY